MDEESNRTTSLQNIANSAKLFLSLHLSSADWFVLELPISSKKVCISLNTHINALYGLSADFMFLILVFYKFLEPN